MVWVVSNVTSFYSTQYFCFSWRHQIKAKIWNNMVKCVCKVTSFRSLKCILISLPFFHSSQFGRKLKRTYTLSWPDFYTLNLNASRLQNCSLENVMSFKSLHRLTWNYVKCQHLGYGQMGVMRPNCKLEFLNLKK